MDKDFQTSFIPKKPIVEKRATASRPVGIFTIGAFFIFFSVLIASAGLYFYKGVLSRNLESMKNDLTISKNRFEPSKITQLQLLDKRLRAATEILSKHVSIDPIFKALQGITMKTVRYTRFSYDIGQDKNAKIEIKMSGQAIGYRSIALQSDLFSENKFMIDPVFSGLSLDEKGNVMFELTFSVDPSFLNYKQTLLDENPDSAGEPVPVITQPAN